MQKLAINVVRSSLKAAQDALDLLEQLNAEQTAPQTSSEVAVASVQAAVEGVVSTAQASADNLVQRLDEELNNPKYRLRTVAELAQKLDMDEYDLVDFAREHFNIVQKTRRTDGADLIGLAHRN